MWVVAAVAWSASSAMKSAAQGTGWSGGAMSANRSAVTGRICWCRMLPAPRYDISTRWTMVVRSGNTVKG